jgi:thioredoxin-like negative regulator of GroEL
MINIFAESELDLKDKLVVFYCYTSWMIGHNKVFTMLKKFEEKYPDITFFSADIDDCKAFIKAFKIKSVPTIIAFNNGKEINRLVGLVLTPAMSAFFSKLK